MNSNSQTPIGRVKAEERKGRKEFSYRTDVRKAENNFQRAVEILPRSISIIDKEGGTYEDYQGKVSLQFKYDALPKTPTCTVWGVYRISSCRENELDDVKDMKEMEEEKRNGKGKALLDRESVNELLDSLDDTDHDLIFRKNISQFRKKIAVMPRFDAGATNTSKMQQKKPGAAENPRGKTLEAFRFVRAEAWEREQKTGRILENICLLLPEAELLTRTLATRIEAGTVEWVQTAREALDLPEESSWAVVEHGVAPRVGQGRPAVADASRRTRPLPRDARKPGRSFSEPFRFFPNPTKCYYVLPYYWLCGFDEKHETNLESLQNDETLNRKSSTKPNRGEKEVEEERNEGREEREVKRRTRQKLEVVYEPACSVLQVLTSSYWDYWMTIYDREPPPSKVSQRNRSETDGNSEREMSNVSVPEPGKETRMAVCRRASWKRNIYRMAENQLDPCFGTCFDGFQIIYNNSKDSLNDDEDDTAKLVFVGNSTGKKRSFAIVKGKSENKMGEKKGNSLRCSYETTRLEFSEILVKNANRAYTYKSNSSPNENVTRTEFPPKDHRPRRSLIISREVEKDSQTFKKRRLSWDKGVEIDRPFLLKKSSFGKASFRSLVFREELHSVLESELRGADRKQMVVLENGAAGVKKEILGGFSSIGAVNVGKGEARGGRGRTSLVILLSRK